MTTTANHTPPRTIKVALIGEGIGPSLTPAMHRAEGRAHGLNYTYDIWDLIDLDLPATAIGELLAKAEREGYSGVNVTHPCKQLALAHLDELDADARQLGAVNTVVFRDGKRYGYNTDFTGFYAGLREGLPEVAASLGVQKITQIGAGGAGSAIAYALLRAGLRELTICETNLERAREFAAQFSALFPAANISIATDLHAAVTSADGIINVTPMGMAAHPGTAFDTGWLRPEQFIADVVYRPLETQLVADATRLGCRVLDGGRMAVHQAVDAFTHFSGFAADPARMRGEFMRLIAAETAVASKAVACAAGASAHQEAAHA